MTVDLILQTKLQPPQIKGKILCRERLLDLLKENLDKKLILICADAGYGKTTLLIQLCSKINKPFMFYDLDASDNDIAAFFIYLVSGIQQHYQGFGQRTMGIIPQTRNIEILVGTFINEFVEHAGGIKAGEEFYIILDDYHHLQQNQQIGNGLDYLLRHLPANLHLIISSRSMPPLDLAYYYAKQELFGLEKEQLHFNLKEIQALLKEIHGLKVPDVEIKRIEKHSEGWITAIQLILQKISALGEEKTKETLNGYIASGEEVFNYFTREVFETQPGEIQEFLIKTSILEDMNSRLCNSLLSIRESEKILLWLETEHIFITKAGNNKYRYHPLFQEFLNKRLTYVLASAKVRRLYQKAGQCFRKNNDYLNAAKHFLNGEYYDRAASILTQFQFTMRPEMFYTFAKLIDRMPLSIIDKYPRLLLGKSKYFSYLGKWDDALQVAIRARRILQGHRDYRGLSEALQQIGFIYLVMMQPIKALKCVKKAYRLTGKRSYVLKSKIMVLLGNIYRALARHDDAEDYLNRALSIARRLNDDRVELEALKGIARVYSERTDFGAAASVFSELFTLYENQRSGLAYIDLCANAAALYIEICDFDKANELLNQAEKLVHFYNDKRAIVYLTGIRGKFHFYKGESLKALEYYETALKLNQELREKLIDLYAQIDIIYIYFRMKKREDAKLLLKNVEKLISEQTPYPILIDLYIIKGRIGSLEKNFPKAKQNYHCALTIADKAGRQYDVMKIYYYLAQLYLDFENIEQLNYNIRRCFEVAQEKNYDFFLIKEAKDNLELFEKAVEREVKTSYLSRILKNVDSFEAKGLLDRMRIFESEYDFEISVFGHLVVKNRNGEILELQWKTQKAKELFVYLIINQGNLIDKDQLRDILWPKKNLTEATHSLHDHIFFVRSILRNLMGTEVRSKEIIRYRNPFYSLTNDIRLKIDMQQFDNLVKKAASLEPTNADKSMELYKKALDLYRGDFCPELYANWVEEKRLFYKDEVVKLIKKVAGYYYGNRNYKESLRLFKLGLNYGRLDEDIHIGIMRCMSILGDKSAVKKQYRELEILLKKNLNMTPSLETQKVYHELLSR